MDPVIFEIGPFALRYYGLMYALAALVGGWLFGKEVRRKSIDLSDDQRWNFVLLLLLGGILGARIYYVALNWEFYGRFPSEIPAVWRGGLAIHGGLIGGVLVGIWFVRRTGLPFWRTADAAAPSIILGQAFGRFGNFMNGDAHGYPTQMPWGIVFPPESIAGREFGPQPLHPVMLYELVLDLGGFFLLWSLRKKGWGDGFIFCSYLLLYSLIRSAVTVFRADDLYLGPFRAPHVVSLLLVIVVTAYIFKKRLWTRHPGRS